MAEGARLESVFTGNRNVGSNPTPSAKPVFPGLRLLCAWRPPPISQVPGGGICLLFFYVVAGNQRPSRAVIAQCNTYVH